MKKLTALLPAILLCTFVFGQAPSKMTYQAVIRDATNHIAANKTIGMRISVLQGTITGTTVYAETHNISSNANGLVTLEIGAGTVTTGTFGSINWSTGPYFLKTEADPAGGTNYTITGTTQLLSVPYALYSNTAQNVVNNNDSDASPSNELQQLKFSNDSLSISKGNAVVLPAAWGLKGNAGTNPTNNFIGTTDNKALIFKVNNFISGKIESDSGNTAFGYRSAGAITTGNNNTSIGHQSLFSNTIADGNTATGVNNLYSNTTGSYNTTAGYNAMYTNTGGNANTGIGADVLYSNTGGSFNTGVGRNALYSNTTGITNTAIGVDALYANTDGGFNTAIGRQAFYTGSNYTNSTAIGAGTVITAGNQVRLGHSSVTSIGGYANWSNVSDGRFKTNVKENVPGLAFVSRLRPVTYYLDMDAIARYTNTPDSMRMAENEAAKGKMLQTGFVAQEVETASNDLGFDFSGVDKPKNPNDFYSLRYAEFTVPLVKAVQELNVENKHLLETIILLQKRIEALEAK